MASESAMSSSNPSLSSSSQSSLSPSRSGDEVDWKERCQNLEGSLLKFKQQAARIRELLAEKMHDMELKTKEAEKRANAAEERNDALELKLANSGSEQVSNNDKRLRRLETECREKDKSIETLKSRLEEQAEARECEAKLLEEKSARIKEWVTNKMEQCDGEVKRLRTENMVLREQLTTLQQRLQSLPTATARELHRISMQSQSSHHQGSRPVSEFSTDSNPPIPKRPSSSIMESIWQERELDQLRKDIAENLSSEASPDLDNLNVNDADDIEADYQEIDDNHESKYEPKRSNCPPQVRIERKVFPNSRLMVSSFVSSTAGSSEELLDRVDSLPGPSFPAATSPLARSLSPQSDMHNSSPPKTLGPLPKFRPAGGGARSKQSPPDPEDEDYSVPPPMMPHSTRMVSALATLPRRKKEGIKYYAPAGPANQPYETQTVDRRLMKKGANFERSQSERKPKPPTPPMRRLPSWENRIYAIANIGLKTPDCGLVTANRESSFPVTDGLYTDRMYQDLTVPVYTTLRGKAAQIRSTPFTGDSSSESSDEEDGQGQDNVMSVAGPSGLKAATSVAVKNHIDQLTRAPKRGVSSHSIASETSSDYAVPPDDEVSIKSSSSENSEPEHKLLKYTTDTLLLKDSSEKCGYLTKLGGKVKNWKRWWFVLKNGELLYYRSPNEITGKPQGHINLNSQTRIAKTESVLTFEICTPKRTYYFTADSVDDMDSWLRVLQNVVKEQAADQLLAHGRAKEVMKGWLIKTKHGRKRRCWCVLMGKFFMYFKHPSEKTPLGQLHLRGARVEEVDRSCDSESDSDDSAFPDYTLAILPVNQPPTYVMVPTRHEKESWLYHLTVATGGGSGKVGTECEQLISKLMEVEGDPSSVHWKNPALLHTKEPIPKSLTTLPSEDLQDKAIDLFKCCHSFTNIAIESQQLDHHVSLAQTIIDVCLQHPELQDEMVGQLTKQTSRHPPQNKSSVQAFLLCGSHSWFTCDASPTSPTNSVMDLSDSKLNPHNYVFVQAWQLLAMIISVFLPKQSILWYLKAHLQRNADPRTDVGKYAVFCQRALDRTMHNGGREARPSRMEVLSILLRNPYHHSQPISIPVHFLNGSYHVISFDGSTSVQEFLHSLNKAIGMRDCALSGFSLFTDDPAGHELEHCLKGHLKLCDVISKWEQALFHHATQRSRVDTNRSVKLTYKNRLYFKSLSRHETEKERLLLVYQTNIEIVNGRFPLNRDLAMELAALMAQIEFGDYRSEPGPGASGDEEQRTMPAQSAQQLSTIIDQFYPKRYRRVTPAENRLLEQMLRDKWTNLRGRNIQECVRIYLTVTRKWPYFGAKLFSARFRNRGDNPNSVVWLAVHEDGISVLEYGSLKAQSNFTYKSVVTFGGCREDFMLVVSKRCDTGHGQSQSKTEKLIFSMSKPKILELTVLMVSYINIKSQHKQMQTQSLPYMPPLHAPARPMAMEIFNRAATLPRPFRPKHTVVTTSMDI